MMNPQTAPHTTTARRALPLGAALLALVATGCAAEDTEGPVTAAPDETAQTEPDGGEAQDDGDAADGSEADAGDDAEAGSSLAVETVGESPYGLVASETPQGTPEEVSGELIVGPGGYLALTQQGQPQLLVFEDGADFTLRGDRPSVTTPDLGTLEVGEEVELTAVEVDRDSLSGLPLERVSGAADTALMVTAD